MWDNYKLPEYNPDGKRLTLEQHKRLKEQYEAKKRKNHTKQDGDRPGRCSQCHQAQFKLHMDKGDLIRTCKNCGDQKKF